jgi:hypothetical protein
MWMLLLTVARQKHVPARNRNAKIRADLAFMAILSSIY